MLNEWSVALPGEVAGALAQHLIRGDGQEDVAFALWNPSEGAERGTALIEHVLLPEDGDRNVHGNASFNPMYLERACREAMQAKCGVAFLHSHPFPGWQGMSQDDVIAERQMAGAVSALTGLPLVGLTVGSDCTWSARIWVHNTGREYRLVWCSTVRMVGPRLEVDFTPELHALPRYREMFRRTVAMWGSENHAQLARMRIGIVGLGSVGSLVAECLARMGCQEFVLIDFDSVESHNLDRLVMATQDDVTRPKVEVAAERIQAVSTGQLRAVRRVPYSIVEEPGYRAALDCDVLFSCVDRPRARHILNHFAYAHLIPVIDGGIVARFRRGKFSGADWQVQTVGPSRRCLECIGAYDVGDVSTEAAGKLDDSSYLDGLPADHRFKQNENVFPYSANLASLEVMHLIALTTAAAGITDFGVQRFRYNPGIMEQLGAHQCKPNCDFSQQLAVGDKHFELIGEDRAAQKSREAQRRYSLLVSKVAARCGGDLRAARRWLANPQPALGGLAPIELPEIDADITHIDKLLSLLDHNTPKESQGQPPAHDEGARDSYA